MVNQAVLLCAGLGTRMRPLSLNTPKPLIQVSGKPLLNYALDILPSNTHEIVLNAHYLSEKIVQYVNGLEQNNISISVEDNLLDSGGGVKKALSFLKEENEAVFTLNTDAVWLYEEYQSPAEQIINAWNPDTMDALWLVVPISHTRGYFGKGDCSVSHEGYVKMNTLSTKDYVFTGLQIIKKHLFTAIPEKAFPMKTVWNPLLNNQRLHAVVFDGTWCDVGTPEGVLIAEEALLKAT